MKERPIIFSAPMVMAILDGRKTQTRRIIKPQFNATPGIAKITPHDLEGGRFGFFDEFQEYRCPYGQPGDRLWVRESWQHSNYPFGPLDPDCDIFYRADYWDDPHGMDGEKSAEGKYRTWKRSFHMPKWASRIDLEITGVRVERLQDISEADAVAEGIERTGGAASCCPWKNYRKGDLGEMTLDCSAPSRSYMTLWESINGAGSWDANPWIWVLEFQRIKP